MNATVSLLKCEHYDLHEIKEKILKGFSLLDFDPSNFRNKKVVIKPNLLKGSLPEKAIITHPEVFRAVVQLVKEYGGDPVMVESPALGALKKVLGKTGYDHILKQENCQVADTRVTAPIFYSKAKTYKRFELPKALFNADVVINLPKFKTHGITYITGAVKNLFGFIHSLNKSKWHLKASTQNEFANFLLDYYETLLNGFPKSKIFLHIMDAIIAMEGEGPGSSGDPRKMGALLLSHDAVAIDSTAARLVGFDIDRIKPLYFAKSRGIGAVSLDEINIKGDPVNAFNIIDFTPPSITNRFGMLHWPYNTRLFKNLFTEKPVPVPGKCSLCYQCKSICPTGAITRAKGKIRLPSYDYNDCIRCLCCMEICPEGAIEQKKGKLQWLLDFRCK